jgi:hypothetical protein
MPPLEAELGGRRLAQLVDVGLLPVARIAHADAEHGDAGVERLEADDQPGLGAGAAGGVNEIWSILQAHVVGLGHHLERHMGIAQRARRVRATARDDVDLLAASTQFLAVRLGLGVHVERRVRGIRSSRPIMRSSSTLPLSR